MELNGSPSRSDDGSATEYSDPRAQAGEPSTVESERHKSAAEIRDLYAGLAGKFERWTRLERLFVGRYRRGQFGDATGRVLDVACGNGTNFRYLTDAEEIVGIDISPEMLAHARTRLEDAPVEGTLQQMDAQRLAFPADSFDTVISALSTCTFPDPVAALEEMRRVCRPDGRILLFEHGRSDVGPIARFQDWRADAHYESTGCRWNQEPLALLQDAGLTVTDSQQSLFGILTLVEAVPE